MPVQRQSAVEASTLSRLTWRLIPFLFLLYIVAYLDRINVGFAALQMQEQLRFSDRVYGLGAGMFFTGYFLFQVPSNLILHQVGARRWIAMLMIVWGVISSSMATVATPKGFYVLRFLLGSAEAGFFPGMILYLKSWFPEAARARAVALFMTAGPISGVVGGPISGVLLGFHPRVGLAGWQWLFLIEGLPAIFLGAAAYFHLADRPSKVRWLSEEQRSWLAETLERERAPSAASDRAGPLIVLFTTEIGLLVFIYFGLNTCSYGISLWLPTLIHSWSSASNFFIGMVSAIPYLTAALAMVLVGQHSDRTGERRWHVALSAFSGAAALWFAAYASGRTLLGFAYKIPAGHCRCRGNRADQLNWQSGRFFWTLRDRLGSDFYRIISRWFSHRRRHTGAMRVRCSTRSNPERDAVKATQANGDPRQIA